ncbi:LysM peptidoglycan-binding domain-containing protein [Desulfofundulus salinus]|uniref:LysM peptidoglycan-binding domain-containing protein n=1 Tax=Desulfofundulus salinus TaxID=2419843 RepID=A0A494WVJ6_9FIRM|nr:LysM peptidoglycan-binding domain-containing protein [Desulfofundulus salinum]RKO67051.1 LysM peptidoglycan-binding domain-containing protein [Desulfofundulus salinum]
MANGKDPQWKARINRGPVLVGSGRIISNQGDVVATTGRRIAVFVPENNIYRLLSTIDVPAEVLSLAVGMGNFTPDQIIAGTLDQILTWSARGETIISFWSTPPEPEARFVSLALGDVNGDGRLEIVAAAEGAGAFYVYEQPGRPEVEMNLQLLAIRLVPGAPQKVTVIERTGMLPLIAVAFLEAGNWGIVTFSYTERGFVAGPLLERLPAGLTAMASGRLTGAPGEDLAWGGDDGRVRIVAVGETLSTVLTTDDLGSAISALAVGRLADREVLVAGTPEGHIFIYPVPVVSPSPERAITVEVPVNDLAFTANGRLVVGSREGRVLVTWMSGGSSFFLHRVRPGETLWELARRYNTSVAEIIRLNGLTNPDRIYPGELLQIPLP